jgi:hypothetical protein
MAYRLSKTTAPLSTRVPIEQARSLQRLAARRGMSVSDVVAVLIEREFGEQPANTPESGGCSLQVAPTNATARWTFPPPDVWRVAG